MSNHQSKDNNFWQASKSGLTSALIFLLFILLSAAASAFVLEFTGQPEAFYDIMGYIIPSLAGYLTGRFVIRSNGNFNIYRYIGFSAVFLLILSVITLIVNNGKIDILNYLITVAAVLILTFYGAFYSKKKKRKKTNKKSK